MWTRIAIDGDALHFSTNPAIYGWMDAWAESTYEANRFSDLPIGKAAQLALAVAALGVHRGYDESLTVDGRPVVITSVKNDETIEAELWAFGRQHARNLLASRGKLHVTIVENGNVDYNDNEVLHEFNILSTSRLGAEVALKEALADAGI